MKVLPVLRFRQWQFLGISVTGAEHKLAKEINFELVRVAAGLWIYECMHCRACTCPSFPVLQTYDELFQVNIPQEILEHLEIHSQLCDKVYQVYGEGKV